ncbi:MAG: ABC transporter ATP-binding protein [Anaerolineales bacterium]|nr:MAG: ABC transporter ATP-binding protein [Anaerolineales bacterium]
MPDALTTKSITKIYRTGSTEIRAVDDVSIRVEIGEFVALVGPSGSGKTTMLAMLAGLLRPSAGEALINDQNLNQMKDSERTRFRLRNIGFTLQANNLVSYLTARENVELMLRLNRRFDKHSQRRARELLVRLGLAERLDNLPSQLSSGEQQRVAIARALVHDPGIVLADEPTANLDTEHAFQVVETFANLIHEQNRTGIMVTHDLRMCIYVDRVIQLVDGQLVRTISDRAEIEALASAGGPVVKPH